MADHAGALRGGIDLGGTKMQAVIVDAAHEVLGQARRPTPTTGGPPDVLEQLAGVITDAAQDAGVATADLIGLGVGAPGAIDEALGTLGNANNLPNWSAPYPLAGELGTRTQTTVRLGNDVSVSTNAEFTLGAARSFRSILGVFWGTGVGGGIVLDGHPWNGRGAAGEVGHIMVDPRGHRCPCGRRGCMEAYAGRRAMEALAREAHDHGQKTMLFRLMEEKGRDRLTSGIWARALEHEDQLAIKLLDDAVGAIGTAAAAACNVLDVQAVVLGGGMGTRFGEAYLERLREAMLPHLFADDDPPAMVVAALGDLGGALGAALLVADAPT